MTLRLYSLCVLLAVVALTAMGAPGPKVNTLDGTWGWAPDSTVAYAASVKLSGALGPRDQIRYTLYKDNLAAGEARTTVTDTTFSFVAPAYSATSLYKVCARVFRADSPSGPFKCAERAFTRGPAPEPPAPVVDSVTITPAQVSLAPGGTVQFQAAVFSH